MSLVLHGTNGITFPDATGPFDGADLKSLVQVGQISHTADTALATVASGGNQMGSAVSMVIPTAGVVRVTTCFLEGDETEGNFGEAIMGVKIGSGAIIWGSVDYYDSAVRYAGGLRINSSVAGVIYNAGHSMESFANTFTTWIHTLDIAGHGMATGTQDVEVWMGDNSGGGSGGEITITGTTTTGRWIVEVIDGT
jgi:hypothetical protein